MGQIGQNYQHIGQLTLNDALKTASETVGVTATPGGGQANAITLNDGCVKITTVASIADSVKLPPAYGGTVVLIANQGANSAQIFGSGIDTINAVATGTGVALAAAKNALFFCTRSANSAAATAGEWYMVLSA